jgi:hypothetical protein
LAQAVEVTRDRGYRRVNEPFVTPVEPARGQLTTDRTAGGVVADPVAIHAGGSDTSRK